MKLTNRELATVLAALRYWQRTACGRDVDEQDIATEGRTIKPLHDHQIDELCDRLLTDQQPRVHVLVCDNNGGVNISAFASRERAEDALRGVLRTYVKHDECGSHPRFTVAQVEAFVEASRVGSINPQDLDAYWIDESDLGE
jgi:hypothetical protein